VIARTAGGADGVREALAALLDPAIPKTPAPGRSGEPLGDPPLDAAFLERCRMALSGLLGLDDHGVIQVSSPQRREGRSSVAAGLATVLARSRARRGVLLLDLDFERPGQASMFSIAPEPGLADFLEGRERLRAVVGGPDQQLCVVPAGTRLGDPVKLLHQIADDDLIEVFRQRFQWVVLDLPPLLRIPEAVGLAVRADWHVIVGRHRRTRLADLRRVRQMLGPDRAAGFLLTGDTSRVPRWIRRRL
jgi:Mrp family chromosome partitioning ATPase